MSLYYPPGKTRYGHYYGYLIGVILAALALIILFRFGMPGIFALSALIIMIVALPLLMDRYSFYLFLWLLISPAFDNMRGLLIAGTNPVVFIMTGITLPFAIILVFRAFKTVIRQVPFIVYLGLFNLVLFLNLLRPNLESGALLECIRLFIEIFIIFCGYQEIKSRRAKRLFSMVNGFIILNSLVAFFQRITGVGMIVVEGLPRVGGLVGHPNCLAFVNVLYIPFAIYQVVNVKNSNEKKRWLAGVVICAIALLMTLCKNVILTFLLQAGILFLFLPVKIKIRVLATVGIGFLIFLTGNAVFNWHFTEHLFNRANNNASLIWRFKVWGYILSSVDQANIWVGHGVNATKGLIAMIDSRGSSYAHNAYLQLLYDYGLTGFFLLMAFIDPAIRFIGFFIAARPGHRFNQLIPLLILLAIFTNMASDNSVFLRTPMVFAWLFLVHLYMQNKSPQDVIRQPIHEVKLV